MHATTKGLLALAVTLFTATQGLAWGDQGHRIIAAAASQGLTPNAQQHVKQLLGGHDLTTAMTLVAVWPDRMRDWQRDGGDMPHYFTTDDAAVAQSFKDDAKNAHQDQWHFVDLPLGTTQYHLHDPGTRDDDVVQTIRRCTRVLQGHAPAGENLTPQQAIRLVIHYVGDMHQPLHASCGYWLGDAGQPAQLADLAHAAQGVSDHGANNLHRGQENSRLTFHIFWDGDMVNAVLAKNHRTQAQVISNLVTANGPTPWKIAGDPLDFPAKWTVESARIAAASYPKLTIVSAKMGMGHDGGRSPRVVVSIPDSFAGDFTEDAEGQLQRAAQRLAALLNSIWP